MRLTVTDQGKTQSIDLRTGQPGPGAVGEYTRPPLRGSAEYTVLVKPRPAYFPGPLNTDVAVSPTLRPFDGRRIGGWAPPGRSWLRMSVKATL